MEHIKFIKIANDVAKKSRMEGNTPFGAILVDENGEILLKQGNNEITEHKCTGHAETQLIEKASIMFEKEKLARCTLYTTVEPCVMCSGALYWAGIGRVVYGLDEKDLLTMTGDDPQNPTFSLPCREVFARGQKKIEVLGPFNELKKEIIAVHEGYWNKK